MVYHCGDLPQLLTVTYRVRTSGQSESVTMSTRLHTVRWYLPTKAATYCRPMGLLKNPRTMAASCGDDGCALNRARSALAADFGCRGGCTPSAAALHTRNDAANAYGFVRTVLGRWNKLEKKVNYNMRHAGRYSSAQYWVLATA